VPGVAEGEDGLTDGRLTGAKNNRPRNITSHVVSYGTRVRDF